MLDHRLIDGDPTDAQRVLTFVDPGTGRPYDDAVEINFAKAVDTFVEPVGATVHGPGAPHYTCANVGNSVRRRVYIFNFVALPAE
jgi:hypothetical protein